MACYLQRPIIKWIHLLLQASLAPLPSLLPSKSRLNVCHVTIWCQFNFLAGNTQPAVSTHFVQAKNKTLRCAAEDNFTRSQPLPQRAWWWNCSTSQGSDLVTTNWCFPTVITHFVPLKQCLFSTCTWIIPSCPHTQLCSHPECWGPDASKHKTYKITFYSTFISFSCWKALSWDKL